MDAIQQYAMLGHDLSLLCVGIKDSGMPGCAMVRRGRALNAFVSYGRLWYAMCRRSLAWYRVAMLCDDCHSTTMLCDNMICHVNVMVCVSVV